MLKSLIPYEKASSANRFKPLFLQDMEMMLSKNAGLKSRFQRFFDFPDWSGNDCTTFIENIAKKENYGLRPEVRALFPARFDELVRYPGNIN